MVVSSFLLGRGRGLLALGAVLGAGLLPLGNALAVEHAPNNMVSHTGQVADAAAAHQDDRVFLEVMPLATDIGCDLFAVGETHPRHLAEGGVRLLGGHCLDLEANPPLERARLEHRGLGLVTDRPARLTNELVDRGHESVVSLTPEPARPGSCPSSIPGRGNHLFCLSLQAIQKPGLAAMPWAACGAKIRRHPSAIKVGLIVPTRSARLTPHAVSSEPKQQV